jgi:hypothetical protein
LSKRVVVKKGEARRLLPSLLGTAVATAGASCTRAAIAALTDRCAFFASAFFDDRFHCFCFYGDE